MKKKTPEQELKLLIDELRRDLKKHEYLKEYGGQDPFWTDGVNLNLVRNHIIYDKREILELCSANGLNLPDEYYILLKNQMNTIDKPAFYRRDGWQRAEEQRLVIYPGM